MRHVENDLHEVSIEQRAVRVAAVESEDEAAVEQRVVEVTTHPLLVTFRLCDAGAHFGGSSAERCVAEAHWRDQFKLNVRSPCFVIRNDLENMTGLASDSHVG